MRLPKHDSATLEDLIDRFNISSVIMEIANIAEEKAQHVRENWQDENLARDWERTARYLDKVASNNTVTNLP